MRRGLAALASRGPVPVYVVGGDHAAARDLMCEDGHVRVASSPRQASILLGFGPVPDALHDALFRLHDQLPHPRATAWCGTEKPTRMLQAIGATHVDASTPHELRAALLELYRALLEGRRPSATDMLSAAPPVNWRGRGDHGQGGEGMVGGTPFGRPMPTPDEDRRDGLALDKFCVTVGPFLPATFWPAGLTLELELQGDVVQSVATRHAALESHSARIEPDAGAAGILVRQLELERAAQHLVCLARYLQIVGLASLARRFRRAAADAGRGEAIGFRALRRSFEQSAAGRAVAAGLGTLGADTAATLSGPAARASGVAEDARTEQPVYAELGFRPITQQRGDVRARLIQWLDEIEQSLQLAAAAGDRRIGPDAALEAPTGHVPGHAETLDANALLAGSEWTQAMTVLASFAPPLLACRAATA